MLWPVSQSRSSKAIGREFVISERTIAQYLTAIFNKLGVKARPGGGRSRAAWAHVDSPPCAPARQFLREQYSLISG